MQQRTIFWPVVSKSWNITQIRDQALLSWVCESFFEPECGTAELKQEKLGIGGGHPLRGIKQGLICDNAKLDGHLEDNYGDIIVQRSFGSSVARGIVH